MDIVYAAEKPSIAELLGKHVSKSVAPAEIEIAENPTETGSFYIGWRSNRYLLSPNGEIAFTASAADVRYCAERRAPSAPGSLRRAAPPDQPRRWRV